MMSSFDLAGKAALITGAAGLLGVQHALALAELGATVVMTDVEKSRLENSIESESALAGSGKTVCVEMDVTREESIQKVLADLKRRGVRIDILINNAAIDPKVGDKSSVLETSRLENFDRGHWDTQLSVGLTGAFLCSKAFGTVMASDGFGGVILNIASDLSVFSPDQRLYRKDDLPDDRQPVKPIAYSVIKAGMIGMTKYLATYWADRGVRCNALSPGGVFTGQDETFVNRLSQLIPLGRMAAREEYRAAIQFLCSDASSYMNGQNVVMDGGRSAW